MRLIHLDPVQTLVVDVLAWVILHPAIGFICSRIPARWFNPDSWLYLTYGWENGGEIYQKLFHVRSWKGKIPPGGALYPGTFLIQRLPTFDVAYLERWLRESCRAEFTHWMMVWPVVFFFLWNGWVGDLLMVLYALANNAIPIVMQRFNRPRLRKVIARVKEKAAAERMAGYVEEQALLSSYS